MLRSLFFSTVLSTELGFLRFSTRLPFILNVERSKLPCLAGWKMFVPRQPSYNGKPLSYWISRYDDRILGKVSLRSIDQHEADEALREIGTNALPYLLKLAGRKAFRAAMEKGSPVILEPVMNVEVVAPQEFSGDLMGDLNSRRGRIQGMDARAGAQVITAQVPLDRSNFAEWESCPRTSSSCRRATFCCRPKMTT